MSTLSSPTADGVNSSKAIPFEDIISKRLAQTLQHRKADPDLAGLRDSPVLAKLPSDEQKACRALWAEVDALLAKSQGTTLKPGK
jgi:hypothetical protein